MTKYLLLFLLAAIPAQFMAQTQGCTQDFACNYDSNAEEDDGSCVFVTGSQIDILNTTFTYEIECFGKVYDLEVSFPAFGEAIVDGVSTVSEWSLCNDVLSIDGLLSVWDGDSFFYQEEGCQGDFIPNGFTNIQEIEAETRTLVKVVDSMGRIVDIDKSVDSANLLFYIYDNGDVEKVMSLR